MLPMKPNRCVLRDEFGRRYFCTLYWHTTRFNEGHFKGGWIEFIQESGLTVGDMVYMGIDKRDPTVIHIGKVNPYA